MNNDQLYRVAPSVFATEPHEHLSDKYRFLPTIQVVDALRKEGFEVHRADQSNTRLPDGRSFAKHQLRLRRETQPRMIDGLIPEVILTNSHNGTSAYQLDFGIFRYVCLNGLTVNDAKVGRLRARHSGRSTLDDVIEGVYELVGYASDVEQNIQTMKSTLLPAPLQREFAENAIALRWREDAPVIPDQVLRPRRMADVDEDVWTVFNRVQEHLIKGGNLGRTKSGKRQATRTVRSIDQATRINRELWQMAMEVTNRLQ